MSWAEVPDTYVPNALEMDFLERAWGLIANAGNGGDWQGNETPEWVEAAEKFRDEVYHPLLRRAVAAGTVA